MNNSAWSNKGKDKNYEHYRTQKEFVDLRKWVDKAYYEDGLSQFLDKDFIELFKNHDFFARLWELELAEWLSLTGLELLPTNGVGPDFCIKFPGGKILWIEAILSTADDALDKLWRSRFGEAGEAKVYDFPKDANALRYASSLYTKAIKIEKYIDKGLVGENDFVLIAISGFPPGALKSSIEHFMRAALPMGDPVVHFNRDGSPLDKNIVRATHTDKKEYTKSNGSPVLKQFLYPGTSFPFIDGVLFTEASNLQNLLGASSSRFGEETNVPHIFPNYSSTKKLPSEFTDNFYSHTFTPDQQLMSLKRNDPKKKLM